MQALASLPHTLPALDQNSCSRSSRCSRSECACVHRTAPPPCRRERAEAKLASSQQTQQAATAQKDVEVEQANEVRRAESARTRLSVDGYDAQVCELAMSWGRLHTGAPGPGPAQAGQSSFPTSGPHSLQHTRLGPQRHDAPRA